MKNNYKIGLGQDSHPFESKGKKPLIMGGVEISSEIGLKGNSDGDVIFHSLCNALSSAIGGDSLGTWSDEMCLNQGIKDSSEYLKYILNKVYQEDYRVGNVSISIEAKKPRISLQVIHHIKNNTAKILDINPEEVGITFTSGEGLTAFGRGEGIQALCQVLLVLKDD